MNNDYDNKEISNSIEILSHPPNSTVHPPSIFDADSHLIFALQCNSIQSPNPVLLLYQSLIHGKHDLIKKARCYNYYSVVYKFK